MATVNYPATLRGPIQANKRRNQVAGYRQADPAGGPPYFERFSDDVPTVWDFSLRFNRGDAAYFWSWLKSRSHADNGNAWFNMNLSTEFGLQATHECHFTADGFPQLSSETRDVLTYNCSVIARVIGDTPDPQTVISFNEVYGGNPASASLLDVIVNRIWPEA